MNLHKTFWSFGIYRNAKLQNITNEYRLKNAQTFHVNDLGNFSRHQLVGDEIRKKVNHSNIHNSS